jgi:hypothetical protein
MRAVKNVFMTREEKYIAFLEERIKTAKSIRSNAAYTLALDQFLKIFTSDSPKGSEKPEQEENH